MEEWKKYKLGDICKSNLNSYSEKDNWNFVNYLDTGNITENKISDIQYIDLSSESLPSRARRKVQIDDIIYSTVRPNQKHFGIIKSQPENFLVSTGFAVLHINKSIADPDFIFYSLIQDDNTEILHAIAEQTTSTYPAIRPTDIENLSIKLPPLAIQKKIAAILSSLDGKIELNNKMNENLEQQAQTLFNHFFTNTNENKSFEIKELEDVTNNLRERIPNNNIPVFSAVNTGNLQRSDDYFSKQVYSKDISKYILVKVGDFAYNPARINIGSIGINDFDYDGCVSPVYVAFSVDKDYRSFFKYYFKSNNFKEETKLRASGSVRQTLNYSDFAKIQIHYPPRDLAKKFEDFHKNIEDAKKKINKENEILISIRDTLLPKLMNGEFEV